MTQSYWSVQVKQSIDLFLLAFVNRPFHFHFVWYFEYSSKIFEKENSKFVKCFFLYKKTYDCHYLFFFQLHIYFINILLIDILRMPEP